MSVTKNFTMVVQQKVFEYSKIYCVFISMRYILFYNYHLNHNIRLELEIPHKNISSSFLIDHF